MNGEKFFIGIARALSSDYLSSDPIKSRLKTM